MMCPNCKNAVLELEFEEVDIGVGVQKFMKGAVCLSCGNTYACCYECLAFEFQEHQLWCEQGKQHDPQI